MQVSGAGSIGNVGVFTTSNGGHPISFWAKQATKKIIHVGENSHPLIIDQAKAYQSSIERVLEHYMQEAVKSKLSTIAFELEQQGQKDLANIIRRF